MPNMLLKASINPYLKARFSTVQIVMLDVVIALLPLVYVAWLAYGMMALQVIGVAVAAAMLADVIFSLIFLGKKDTLLDGSAVVTGLLLAFTLSPATPLYIVVFGSFSAILFGKIVWGGLGKNRFNPALVGREFMSVFFASTMSSSGIWKNNDLINTSSLHLFENSDTVLSNYLEGIFFKTSGALGEYSAICLVLGGVYLMLRNRISWHIPLSLLGALMLMLWLFGNDDVSFSTGGVLLGAIFMATDMPSSPTTKYGKLYYGMMIGITIYIFIIGGCRQEYMSYAILMMNGFSHQISLLFQPRVWGQKIDRKAKLEDVFMLTLKILAVSSAILTLYYYELIHYLVYIFVIYLIFKFNYSFSKQVDNTI
ncbi:RnfABCDGE type electron transport complex subunit D [Sphingobacterium sp. lm-10]|uniref:RnfABCDGE type electron transport complex subunit D n=1 Tax=Sphingobacterium sp. lm-10 TaxID=2944904 RepID=UPI0020229AD5|nr:RnfABCDGE type electron transport complex subunit D [Sphingobacterium sp. lm-10]MCL7986715.1 RnfABCDGE type electron transport complex subunit D [Sphingobacterium sp. lm-10]